MTDAYPDIVEMIKENISNNNKLKNFILDSEIVGFEAKTNKILSF
jgi:hypothetical protein